MKTNTLPTQILDFFRQNPGQIFNGPELTRRIFPKYAYGQVKGSHSPKAISRRLQELAEDGSLNVSYTHGQAHYKIADTQLPKKYEWTTIETKDEHGHWIRISKQVLTTTV